MDRGSGYRKPASWTARVLAPLALAVVALIAFVIVSGSLDGNGDGNRERERASQPSECQPDAAEAVEDGYYVIQPGEPGLSSVASRTCISLDRLLRLNEDLDPQAIPPLACIDLRPEGCKALADES